MNFKYGFLMLWIISLLLCGCQQKNRKQVADPGELISIKTLGLAYLEENQLEEAEAEFLKLVELDPAEVLGYANLGVVYLRMGKYEEAEEWLKKAIKMDAKDPDIRLILAKVYEMSKRTGEAISELEQAIRFAPGHIKSLYHLTELYASLSDDESIKNRHKYTASLVEVAPGNIVPRLNFIEILMLEAQTDMALEQLEGLRQIFPEFPKEAVEYYDKTMAALQVQDVENAAVSFMIFHNYLKVTTPYQAGILELKGPGGSLIGFPVITFDQQQGNTRMMDWQAVLEAIKFTDITSSAGLDILDAGPGKTHITASDYDGDGNTDLYLGLSDRQSGSYKHYLLKNELGNFRDVSLEAGLTHQGVESAAKFGDYNNDGFLDLFIVKEGSDILYKNTGEGTFVETTLEADVGSRSEGNMPLFLDFDHDGDLDLFIATAGPNILYRNNADGTFLEQAEKSNLSGGKVNSADAAFGDFDDDGDIDLFVVNSDGPNALNANQRQGIFRDITAGSGLSTEAGSNAVAAGDYNNDGFLDLFVTSPERGQCRLYRNLGDGSFETDNNSPELNKTLGDILVYDVSFLDFDNDGFLDLLVAGDADKQGNNGVSLFHNDGTGQFFVVLNILPEDLSSGRQILTMDFNEDGDTDVLITGIDGSVRLLRNDGGNNNHYLKMKLVGLRTGSAKNNYYGIGAKVEIRAGNLYQSKIVTEPDIHFGLGPRSKAEVVRILWTNGVPQNIFFPGTDQDLVEEQILKGSCPFLYTWNGEEYVFLKDIMWRSALGMPLGIMGETKEFASPDASVDYIKIPGESLKPKNGKYNIQVTGELWETIYYDKLALIALDHPDSVEVFVDEGLFPPHDPGYKVYQVRERQIPAFAFDVNGVDQLPFIAEKDDKYVSNLKPGRYQGLTEKTELTLDLGEIDISKDLILFLNGWIFPTDASINASISQSDAVQVLPPYIQAINKRGEWETIVENLSFPMGKDKTIVANLSGKISSSHARIRIITNMEIYWDHIFYANDLTDSPIQSYSLTPSSADLHYRGFSRTFRKGGRYGPHWFDYSEVVSTGQPWRDLLGNYTRYGDVLPLLMEADNKYIIKNAGDETSIEFNAEDLPALPDGWKRDFLIHSVGWVKDGDLNTASGKTVGPLPFHGMTRYPYGPDESYPDDIEHQKYLREYNTRRVSNEHFINALAAGEDQTKTRQMKTGSHKHLLTGSRGILMVLLLLLWSCQPMSRKTQTETSDPFKYLDWDITQMQQAYKNGTLTIKEVVQAYLDRIAEIDQSGHRLNSIIQVNPDAIQLAEELDMEMANGRYRGPLFGIPVVLKDNIDTHDRMATTAGSRALKNSYPLQDSYVARQLKEAGAIIIGKANLSEWANFRGQLSTSGWSGLGGQTKNPYVLDRNPCGSSSGSGVAVSANLTMIAIGTETNGSIVCPSQSNGIVGLKPTVGLVSRTGIIPISFTQDTPGPMARTVRDAAICLGVLAGVDPTDEKTMASQGKFYRDYTQFLKDDGLKGKRIGFYKGPLGRNYKVDTLAYQAVDLMKSQGAEIFEIDRISTANPGHHSFQVMLFEYKDGLNKYFSSLGPDAPIRNLDELILFNRSDSIELKYFNQRYLEMASEKGDLSDEAYLEALAGLNKGSREEGLDRIMDEHGLDAIMAPTGCPAWKTDLINGDSDQLGSSSPAAMAGYPNITVPMGFIGELPVGISFFGRAWSEPVLLEIAYAYEAATKHRKTPKFLSSD